MDAKLTDLLMKARKGADAGFGVAQWGQVLSFCGFSFVTDKIKNSVVKVAITSPMGEELVIEKQKGCKHIVFYTLRPWLKKIGVDIGVSISNGLGINTPEEEKVLKDLYVRDLTNTGTCPVCMGNFKRNSNSNGGLVHHGFLRPGDGSIHGDCFGVGYGPWELSPKGATDYLELALRPHLVQAQDHLANLHAGAVTKFFKKTRNYIERRDVTIEVTEASDPREFGSLLDQAIYNAESDIRHTERDIRDFEIRIINWKLDLLPEVKYAGKFKKVG